MRLFKLKGSYGVFAEGAGARRDSVDAPPSVPAEPEERKDVALSHPKVEEGKENEKPVNKSHPFGSVQAVASKLEAAPSSTPVPAPKKSGGKPMKLLFGGGDKCAVCSKSAYPQESQNYDGKVFHQACFKCKECKMALSLRAVAQLDGDLYCKTCFVRMFKTKGSYGIFGAGAGKKEHTAPVPDHELSSARLAVPTKHTAQRSLSEPNFNDSEDAHVVSGSAKAKVALFQAKSHDVEAKAEKPHASAKAVIKFGSSAPKCHKCTKAAYPEESQAYDEFTFHKACFKCLHCNSSLTVASVAKIDGRIYCKPCFTKMFKTKGSYGVFTKSGQDVADPALALALADDHSHSEHVVSSGSPSQAEVPQHAEAAEDKVAETPAAEAVAPAAAADEISGEPAVVAHEDLHAEDHHAQQEVGERVEEAAPSSQAPFEEEGEVENSDPKRSLFDYSDQEIFSEAS